ncbi:hypothetical protein [Amorphus orientalis]|uniref:Small lipoprotein YifL n=1 Tax=Amorphus orientalis TaxID=649198 RepID=A0AAE3VL86_9HYPH|nr:hypothetical protein [Amorphus orientalis]MDQ0314224.1 putative small lipoprotein YifL [Amorphus orientalis]
MPATAISLARRVRGLMAVLATTLLLAGCGSSNLTGVVNFPGSDATPVNQSDVTFAFEPFTGMPGNVADALAEQIAEQAETYDIVLTKRVDADATYRVKGFLSSVSTDNGASIVYVFDVFDASGTRLHRITGNQQSTVTAGDPWSGVGTAILRQIALDLILELQGWLGGGAR